MAGKRKLGNNVRQFRAARFGRALRVARAELDLTLEETVERFPVWAQEIVDATTLSRYERGQFRPEIVVLIAIVAAYRVSETVLLAKLREDIDDWNHGRAA
jgi:transcriptional regulator with XRE-family HTH domain